MRTKARVITLVAILTILANGCRGPFVIRNMFPVEGRDWRSPLTGMEFVWIPQMKIWVGKYEVTNGEYRIKEPDHDSGSYKGNSFRCDRQPVVYVNFDDCVAYAEWLTLQDRKCLGGLRYRLPCEDEWMTYAQCGDGREYPWGNDWPPPKGLSGNYGTDDDFPVTAPVDKLWRNPWGLYGVGGNVLEACVARDSSDMSFTWRGGSWFTRVQNQMRCSYSAYRDGSARFFNQGFRLVLSR